MEIYYQNRPLISNLFRNRIKTAIELSSINDDSVILDIGCDTGYLLKTIRELNYSCKCYGIDKDQSVLQPIENCVIQHANAKKLPFPNEYFDLVFVLDVLEHIREYDIAVKEIKRILKPNGYAILSGPTESWFYKFCRFLWLQVISYPQSHLHTVYDIEKGFELNGFKLMARKSLPSFSLPALFRISKFKKL